MRPAPSAEGAAEAVASRDGDPRRRGTSSGSSGSSSSTSSSTSSSSSGSSFSSSSSSSSDAEGATSGEEVPLPDAGPRLPRAGGEATEGRTRTEQPMVTIGMGKIHLARKTMYAKCGWCEARVTRSLNRKPLGFLAAWLMECPGPADAHFATSQGPGEPFPLEDRRHARNLVMATCLVGGKLLQDGECHGEASDEMEPKRFL